MKNNILDIKHLKLKEKEEIFEKILSKSNIYIERIISYGYKTDDNSWMYDKRNEWVILLQGKASILFKNGKVHKLNKGDFIFIKPKTKHKILYTSKKPPCIWLAIYF